MMPALWIDIRDHSNLPGYSASRATGVGGRATTRWTTEGSCSQRGIYTLGPLELHTSDPFGLFDVTLEHRYSESFVVYPPLAAIPRLFEPRGNSRGSARTNIRTLDLTTNAGGVRQYVPGDALNRIHWRTTARRSMPHHEELFVKEFDLEPSGDLWILVDMDTNAHAGQGLQSTEEYAVILAASLANEMLLANHAVGLFTHTDGPLIVPPLLLRGGGAGLGPDVDVSVECDAEHGEGPCEQCEVRAEPIGALGAFVETEGDAFATLEDHLTGAPEAGDRVGHQHLCRLLVEKTLRTAVTPSGP